MKSKSVINGYDYAEDFFSAIEEQGNNMDILFATVQSKKSEDLADVEQYKEQNIPCVNYSHAKYDGIGSFLTFLDSQKVKTDKVLECKNPYCPPNWMRYYLFLKLMVKGKIKDARDGIGWKDYDYHTDFTSYSPKYIKHWFLLSREETEAFEHKTEQSGVSNNSYLLNLLQKHCAPFMILDTSKSCKWMIPVNLRGPVALDRTAGNHSASLGIYVSSADQPEKTHKYIKKAFKANDHWATWDLMTITKAIGKKKLIEGIKKSDEKGIRPFIGTFSNLGSWSLQGFNGAGMLFCPPPSTTAPFAAGALKVNGSLGFAFQIHPSLKLTESSLSDLISNFKSELFNN